MERDTMFMDNKIDYYKNFSYPKLIHTLKAIPTKF